jgi:hypothetical protein
VLIPKGHSATRQGEWVRRKQINKHSILPFFFFLNSCESGFTKNVNARVQSVQKISKFFVTHWEESMAGLLGVKGAYEMLGKGNTKGNIVGAGGVCRPTVCFSFPGAFKTYTNLWEGKKQEIPKQ